MRWDGCNTPVIRLPIRGRRMGRSMMTVLIAWQCNCPRPLDLPSIADTGHAATLDTGLVASGYPGGSRTHLSSTHFQYARAWFLFVLNPTVTIELRLPVRCRFWSWVLFLRANVQHPEDTRGSIRNQRVSLPVHD